MVTDPASQILMLEEAIETKTTELAKLPDDATKRREKLEFEIDILKEEPQARSGKTRDAQLASSAALRQLSVLH